MFVDEFDDRFDCNHKGAWIDVDDQHPGMFYIATNYDDEEHFIYLNAEDCLNMIDTLNEIYSKLRREQDQLLNNLQTERDKLASENQRLKAEYDRVFTKYSGLLSVFNNLSAEAEHIIKNK